MTNTRLFVFLTAACYLQNLTATYIGYGLEIWPIVEKIDNSRKPWFFLGKKPVTVTCSGVKIAAAFEKHNLKTPVDSYGRYTISNVLDNLDQLISQEIFGKRPHQHVNYTLDEFRKSNNIKKRYLDKLPEILKENYGEAALPYIIAIERERILFEASHNGALLELF